MNKEINNQITEENAKIQQSEKKVFREDLPRKTYNTLDVIDWEGAKGTKLRFVYNDLTGEFIIGDYNSTKSEISLFYNGEEHKIKTNALLRGRIGRVVGRIKREHIYNLEEIIETKNGRIKITKQIPYEESRTKEREYEYVCLLDGYNGVITEGNLKSGRSCPICSGRKVKPDINSIYVTHPHIVKYFVNEDDSKKYSHASSKYVDFKCYSCGEIKSVQIYSIVSRGEFACDKCRDGNSYPNKFMIDFFNQLGIEIECEKIFEWSGLKRYDIYIPSLNMLVENHGKQHYVDSSGVFKGLAYQIKNDKEKREMALNNGISYYVEVDCRETTIEHIKKSIQDSLLSELFDISNVSWESCNASGLRNNLKVACDMWNNGEKDVLKISKELGVCERTVRNYLTSGRKFGMCNYGDSNHVKERHIERRSFQPCCKKVAVYKDDVELGVFNSISNLCRKSPDELGVTFSLSCVSRVCNGKEKHHKGYTFKYVNDEKESD